MLVSADLKGLGRTYQSPCNLRARRFTWAWVRNILGSFWVLGSLVLGALLNDYIKRRNDLRYEEHILFSSFRSELNRANKRLEHNDIMIKFGLDAPLVDLPSKCLEIIEFKPPKILRDINIYKQIMDFSDSIDSINYGI